MTEKSAKKSAGFTIVELLVVIVVIGILAAVTIVSYTGISQKATVASLVSDLDNASKLLKMDQIINSTYPSTLSQANGGKGIPSSYGTTYEYFPSSSGFCVTATKGDAIYRVTNDLAPTQGDCFSHGLVLNLDPGNASSYPSPFTGVAWNDLSGMGNNGLLVNGVSYSSDGGGSLAFDGIDDHAYIQNSSSLYFQEYSYFAWVKISNFGSGSDTNTVLSKWGTSSSRQIQVNLQINSAAKLRASVAKSTNDTTATTAAGNTVIAADQWYMIGCTFSNQILKVWLNGALEGSINTGYSSIAIGGSSNLYIGKFDFTWSAYRDELTGKIGNIQVFSREITQNEITNKFNTFRVRYGI